MASASPKLPQPWDTFLAAVDHLPRPTGDLDYIEIIPHHAMEVLQRIAGPESPVATKYHLYVQHVGVASLPESYVERVCRNS